MTTKTEEQNILMLVLYGVALAMGIVSVILQFVGDISPDTILTLLGIGVFCLGLAGINSLDKSS